MKRLLNELMLTVFRDGNEAAFNLDFNFSCNLGFLYHMSGFVYMARFCSFVCAFIYIVK